MRGLRIVLITLVSILLAAGIGLGVFFNCTETGIRACNNYKAELQSADDDTSYATKRAVEDTCRAMIAEYNSDKLTYEQYKDSTDPEKQSWAEQAKMRANQTVSKYNNYILKNKYIWKNNVPSDIYLELSILV